MGIGILTLGRDCPGLNAAIRGAVLKSSRVPGNEFVGFKYGWQGVVNADIMHLDRTSVRGLSKKGGTILCSSQTNPFEGPRGGPENMSRVIKENGIDAILALGGESTLTSARRLAEVGLPVVGLPKTIDNDHDANDYSFGFNTAVEIATEAVDRIRTTAESHQRCIVVEVMGRNAGWIALHAGMATGAHAILIPEQPRSIAQICEWVNSVRHRGRAPVIVVAEGFVLEGMTEAHSNKGLDAFERPRLGGIADILAPMIEAHAASNPAPQPLDSSSAGCTQCLRPRIGNAPRYGSRRPCYARALGQHGRPARNQNRLREHRRSHPQAKAHPVQRYEEAAFLFG